MVAMLIGERIVLDDAVVASLKRFITGVFAHLSGKRIEIGRLLPTHKRKPISTLAGTIPDTMWSKASNLSDVL